MKKLATRKSTVTKIEDLAVKGAENVRGGLSLNFTKIEYKTTPLSNSN